MKKAFFILVLIFLGSFLSLHSQSSSKTDRPIYIYKKNMISVNLGAYLSGGGSRQFLGGFSYTRRVSKNLGFQFYGDFGPPSGFSSIGYACGGINMKINMIAKSRFQPVIYLGLGAGAPGLLHINYGIGADVHIGERFFASFYAQIVFCPLGDYYAAYYNFKPTFGYKF